ncbi:MAG TPA: Os1348 family NHLP clan protein [Acidimicrobiia bacterium]|nr:Os1348 family NHLP clan protein [Acidimicrobiia bacterium]
MAHVPGGDYPMGFNFLVGKAAFDPEFAGALSEDPPGALRSIGIEPTDEILNALKRIDTEAIKALAAAFDDERGVV